MNNKKPSEEAKEPDMEAELIVGVVIDTEEKFSALMKYLGLPNTGKVHPLKVVPMKDGMTSIPLSTEDVEGYKKLSEEAKAMRSQEDEQDNGKLAKDTARTRADKSESETR